MCLSREGLLEEVAVTTIRSSERWRKLVTIAGNPRQRSRLIANMDQRYEAQQQQSAPLLERQELQESTGVTIIQQPPPPQYAPSLEIDIQDQLQESGVSTEPNPEVASKVEGIFFVVNILAELLSVAFDHLSSVNKHRYALIAMIMSYAAAIVCILELAYKARKGRVVWRWESKLPWFYHPSPDHKPFGTVPEMTGLVCAILQAISSTVAYVLYLQHVNYSFNVSLLPLVLALAIFCSRFMKKRHPEVLPEGSDNIHLNEVLVQVP